MTLLRAGDRGTSRVKALGMSVSTGIQMTDNHASWFRSRSSLCRAFRLTAAAVTLGLTLACAPDGGLVGPSNPDLDGDGILNLADRCPSQPETVNRVFDRDGCPDTPADLYAAVQADVNVFWNTYFATVLFRPYGPPGFRLFVGGVGSPCGAGAGPFYCGLDRVVYLDDTFMQAQLTKFGDFAPAMIIAHEVGHHTQNLLGLLGQLSIQKELQADCLAGGWSASAGARGLLDAGDLQEAAGSLFAAADAAGVPWFAPGAHGTGVQRQQAFSNGFLRGAGAC